MAKETWQKNTVVVVMSYSLEYLSQLMEEGKRPGALRITLDKDSPQEKIYRITPGVKCKIPVRVATDMEKISHVASVVEVQ